MMRDFAAGEILLSHSVVRVGSALLILAAQLAILTSAGALPGPMLLIGLTTGYITQVALVAIIVARRGLARPGLVTAVLTADLAFICGVTLFSATRSVHYERALFGALLVMHVAYYYFGRRQARRAMAIGFVACFALFLWGVRSSAFTERLEDMLSLAFAAAVVALVAIHATRVRRRLRLIVSLFERAEEGDFGEEYDESGDQRLDAIARVGRAYNRVRTQLASMVLTDPLTGCLNRRGFDQSLAREVARSSRAGSELALLAVDLDHFKLVNDTWGHVAGDEVLRAFAHLLEHAARAGDVVARMGGEEFAVLLPDTDAAGAFHLASRICDAVRAHAFTDAASDGSPIRVTTSIGAASCAPLLMSTDCVQKLTRHADAALYAAKRSGRDRVRTWSAEPDSPDELPGPGEHRPGGRRVTR